MRSVWILLACWGMGVPVFAAAPAEKHFDTRVAPVLIQRCLACHSGGDPKGGLDLSTSARLRSGGDSGPAISPRKPQESLLWERVANDEMPPEQPLSDAEKQVLQTWIAQGARWGEQAALDPFRFTTTRRAGYDWWSLQPIQASKLPPLPPAARTINAVDHFVQSQLAAHGLTQAAPAARRDLIRRATFDLWGLPPQPRVVQEFVEDDRPDAYARLLDQLLASPHYGIRWGRHWLDLARFGESQGFERDKIRNNSWPYRDWVIEAFNHDLPYDTFTRQQLAGDILAPNDGKSVTATGFLVAGPYDEVGQSQQSAAMKAVVRQDELEDIVSVVSQTFLGLTVNCARCHDHKFDPITQREYYQLSAALGGVRHGSRNVTLTSTEALQSQITATQAQIQSIEQRAGARLESQPPRDAKQVTVPQPIARWTFDNDLRDSLGSMDGRAVGGAKVVDGRLVVDGQGAYVITAPLAQDLRAKTLEAWVRLHDLDQRGGAVMSLESATGGIFDAIVFGEQEPQRWMAGSDSFRRTQSFGGPADSRANTEVVHVALAYHADGTIRAYRNGQPYGTPYTASPPITFTRQGAHILFGLRHRPRGGNRQLSGAIEGAQLYDCALTDAQVARSAATSPARLTTQQLADALTDQERQQRERLQQHVVELRRQIPKPQSVYAVTPRPPGVGNILLRGNPRTPGEEVTPNGIAAIVGLEANFNIPPNATDAERRRQLAGWISNPRNPLFARVIANRWWLHHFGAGMVSTPSDFGFNGGQPSHPALLDHLATEVHRHDWSLKHLHRIIMSSATYRQSSEFNPVANGQDANNQWLWRSPRRRLDAETLRDSVLSIAGALNSHMHGPGFRDFDTFTHNTQFYTMKDPVGSAFNRRSVYRTWIRSGRNRFLDAFDCPDPSTKAPQRAMTVTPLQSLALMNNSFVLRMSDRFAARLHHESGNDPTAQIARAYDLAFQRAPTAVEAQEALSFVTEHGLSELCRVLFNCNEFLYVD